MVAPVSCVVAAGVVVRVLGARWGKELARGAGGKGYLDAAQADIEVDVVLEDEGRLEPGVEEPVNELAVLLTCRPCAAKTEMSGGSGMRTIAAHYGALATLVWTLCGCSPGR
jgi:hypothetical protein